MHPDTCNNVVFVPPSFLKASETRRVAADLEASVREKAVVKVKGLFCEDGGVTHCCPSPLSCNISDSLRLAKWAMDMLQTHVIQGRQKPLGRIRAP